MSKSLPTLCVVFKSPGYLVFFLGRTLILWLDWLKELEPSLLNAAQFGDGAMVEASELLPPPFQSVHIT